MASTRQTRSALVRVQAECAGCNWYAESRNALGLAAIHHDSTGHEVTTRVERVVVYGDNAAMLEELGQTSLLPEGTP